MKWLQRESPAWLRGALAGLVDELVLRALGALTASLR